MPTSFLITFLAALLGQGFTLWFCYLVEAIMDYCLQKMQNPPIPPKNEP